MQSSRRGRLILFDNFTYSKKETYGDATYWVCSKYKMLKCSARAKTCGDALVYISGSHNHAPAIVNKDYFLDY